MILLVVLLLSLGLVLGFCMGTIFAKTKEGKAATKAVEERGK